MTSFASVPELCGSLLACSDLGTRRLPNLRYMTVAGAAIASDAALETAKRIGPARLFVMYGQTEATARLAYLRHEELPNRPTSIGKAAPGVELRVHDRDDRPVAVGETGELCARGPGIMLGYWRDAAATNRVLKNGWLRTGDLGYMDVEGFVTLKDRSKDMLISGGSNIYPREIEEVLLHAPGVAEVAVVGRPHNDWGEEVVAFAVVAPGVEVDAAALDTHCLANLARFKRPRDYRFVEALPKNNYGKVLKTALRDLKGD